jgi:hypothetical protein
MAPSFPTSFLRSLNRCLRDNSRFKQMTSYLPPLNFITVHYSYFIVVCLVASLIFYGMSTPQYSIGYTDSLFLVVSAMTEAGLNTVNLSQMTTGQQFLLWILIMLVSVLLPTLTSYYSSRVTWPGANGRGWTGQQHICLHQHSVDKEEGI